MNGVPRLRGGRLTREAEAAAAYGVAAYASSSRLSENKHYASDVVLGPTVVPGGVAVTFTGIERR